MKLTLAIAFAFAIPALVSASAIHVSRGLPKGCGAGGQVLTTTTISHNGGTVEHVSGTCSGSSAKRSELEERQSVCTTGCEVTCEALSSSAIYVSDCVTVIDAIAGYSGSFLLPAQQYAYWTYGSCTVTIANVDSITYTVCYDVLAYDAAVTVEDCLGITAGALCTGNGGPGQLWGIAIS